MSAFGAILLQKSKIERPRKISRKMISRPLYRCKAPRADTKLDGRFSEKRRGLLTSAHEMHQRLQKISFATPKDFFDGIDPMRSSDPRIVKA
jgi:hypothetical protein